MADHKMHSEWFEVPDETVAAIAATQARGGRVVSVGTTTLRALESAALGGRLQAGAFNGHGGSDRFALERQLYRMGWIADLRLSLVTTLHGDREINRRCRCIREGKRQVGFDRVVINLDITEKLVVLLDALGQVECAESQAGLAGLGLDPTLVEVVILGDRPVQGNAVRPSQLGLEDIRLFDRQQPILLLRLDGWGKYERREQGNQQITEQGNTPAGRSERAVKRCEGRQDTPTSLSTQAA